MKITDVSIDNRTAVAVLVFILVVMGMIAYTSLPRESSPDISIPLLIISTPYPGVSPEDIETLITKPIEKELNGISEIKKITSSSFEGYSIIQAEFQSGYNIDDALTKVREKVDRAKPELPTEAEEPQVIEINFSEFPILTFNISGPVGLVRLKELAEDMQEEIEKINGVLEVKVQGGMEREVKVDVDADRMLHYNIRFADVVDAISNENVTVPGGTIDVNASSFIVRVPGEYKDPLPIENIVIKMQNGNPIYIRDVATVSFDFKDRTTFSRLNGQEAVSVSISKRVGENIIDIAKEIKALIAAKQKELPQNIKFSIVTDESIDIDLQVKDLENNIFSGLVLVVLVLLFFMGVRTSLLVAISIPLSMLLSFMILEWLGVTLNFVVLFALILALGMLVDNAIVIIENIYNYLEQGMGKLEAAKKGTAEVAWPVTTSTLTTVAAFFPLMFWPGVVGDFMYFIPLMVIITLSSSLFVALIINPVITSKYIKLETPDHKPVTLVDKLLHPLNKITHFFVDNMLPHTLALYEKTLNFALGGDRKKGDRINRRNYLGLLAILLFFIIDAPISAMLPPWWGVILTLVLGIGVMLVFSNIRLRFLWGAFLALLFISGVYGVFQHGVEFFPTTQPRRVFISVEAPTGTNIETMNEKMKKIEADIIALKSENIKDVLGVVGSSNNPFDAGASTPNKGTITIQFVDYTDRTESSIETAEKLRELMDQYSGITFEVKQEENGPPVGLPVNVQISGDDYAQLESISDRIQSEIKKIPGLVDMKEDLDAGKPELRVEMDRERAALYGLSTGLTASTIRTAINGAEASKFRVGEDEYDITVRLAKDQRSSVDALTNLRINFNNKEGKTLSVPLSSVADIYQGTGPGAIRRLDLKRVITITADVSAGYNENDVLAQVKEKIGQMSMPQGYSISYGGQNEFQEEAQSFLVKAFLIALLSIFLILVIQFNSVGQPFIIMTAVVVSLVGVFIGLIVYAMPFGIVMTGIGVISLAGVVVNNNIVLIDYINILIKEGYSRREAAIQAGLRRFRPVTLTAITTVLGLIPLSFGFGFDIYSLSFQFGGESAEFWRSMGIAIIFGLTFATFLTLIIVPVMYTVFDDFPDAIRLLFTRKKRIQPETAEVAE